jgi:hypothetical protein
MLLVLAMAAALLAVVVGVNVGRTSGSAAKRWSRWLRWAALAAAAAAAALLAPAAMRDSGRFAIVLMGVPVALAALPLAWELITGRASTAVEWPAAGLTMVWAILLALGIGLAFVPAALLQLAAAATTTAAGPSHG